MARSLAPRKSFQVRQMAVEMLENPTLSRDELALKMGISYQMLCRLIRESPVLQAIRGEASKKLVTLIPLAIKGIEDSLSGTNEKVKFMASTEVLRSEKILGPERIDVTVTDNSSRTVEEMQEEIRKAQKVPSPTIDAEIIS